MLDLQIDPHSGVPVYRQIMDQIRYYAASGLLKPASQLPSIRELALSLSVNPTTVVKAYSELEHESVIEMRHGKGAFLADTPRMSDARRRQVLRRLARQLAVEAVQMDASNALVVSVVTEELDTMRASRSESQADDNDGEDEDLSARPKAR
jgi:GntR family transcriptional regulator